ncbi:MAG TPA: hypothetical protein VGM05_10865 [Planctomycetaceae bacterium]
MLRRLKQCELLVAGSLLVAGAAGCAGGRNHTTAAKPQPETRIDGGASGAYRLPQNPGFDEEYPDFRNGRQNSPDVNGPGLPPPFPGQSSDDMAEPPPFPGVEQQDDGGPAASRSSRSPQRQMVAGLQRQSTARTIAMPVSERRTAGSAAQSPTTAARATSRPFEESPVEPMYAPLYDSRRTAAKPPEWSSRRVPDHDEETGSASQFLASAPSFAGSDAALGQEPVRMSDPPRLNAPPSRTSSSGETELLNAPSEGLEIAKLLVCRQVRGFDDLVELNAQSLRQGQPILLYAALDKFLSIATGDGYRTQTLSTLEIQTLRGDVLLRIPLGTAVDVVESPRQDFFLTHRVTIPVNLPSGSYVFDLRIDDVQSRESARSQVHVTVTADRSPPDEMGGTSKFATRPDSFLR